MSGHVGFFFSLPAARTAGCDVPRGRSVMLALERVGGGGGWSRVGKQVVMWHCTDIELCLLGENTLSAADVVRQSKPSGSPCCGA